MRCSRQPSGRNSKTTSLPSARRSDPSTASRSTMSVWAARRLSRLLLPPHPSLPVPPLSPSPNCPSTPSTSLPSSRCGHTHRFCFSPTLRRVQKHTQGIVTVKFKSGDDAEKCVQVRRGEENQKTPPPVNPYSRLPLQPSSGLSTTLSGFVLIPGDVVCARPVCSLHYTVSRLCFRWGSSNPPHRHRCALLLSDRVPCCLPFCRAPRADDVGALFQRASP